MSTAYLTKRVMFSAMHELRSPHLSDAENREVFGKCYGTHGHNYYVEATVKGTINSKSGLICDRDYFDDVLSRDVVNRFSGKHMNKIFASTTGEDLAREIFNDLKEKLKPLQLVCVRLQETPKNFFTWGDREIYEHPERIF
jgi:6-pyruvoyltetrahydropterin/6-carboxytetrahydropterin synthase